MKRRRMEYCGRSWRSGGAVVAAVLITAAPAWARPQTDFRLEREIRWRLVPVFAGPVAGPATQAGRVPPKSRAAPE